MHLYVNTTTFFLLKICFPVYLLPVNKTIKKKGGEGGEGGGITVLVSSQQDYKWMAKEQFCFKMIIFCDRTGASSKTTLS